MNHEEAFQYQGLFEAASARLAATIMQCNSQITTSVIGSISSLLMNHEEALQC